MEITVKYLPVFGLIFVFLSVRTLLLRRSLQASIGDGNSIVLRRAIRAHGNFAEYVPISLLLIYFLEEKFTFSIWVHCLCIALIIGRCIHAYGVSQSEENFAYRVAGMALTLGVIISTSLSLLFA